MEKQHKTHVYFLPGMSADHTIFERMHLPTDKFEMHFLDWLMPKNVHEPFSDYVKRFATQITASNPVLIGVSFGGLLAQEIAQIIPCGKIVIISSVKSPTEFSPFFKFLRRTRLFKLHPISFINWLEKTVYNRASGKLKRTLTTYRKYLPVRDKVYTKWAIKTFLLWKGCQQNMELLHIHGDQDFILPHKYIHNCFIIKNGTHAMIVSKTHTIEHMILKFLS